MAHDRLFRDCVPSPTLPDSLYFDTPDALDEPDARSTATRPCGASIGDECVRRLIVRLGCVMALLLLKRRGNPTGIFNIEQCRISRFDAGCGVRPVASSSTEYRGSGLVPRLPAAG